MNRLPDWIELTTIEPLDSGWNADLRIDTGDFRVWTARTGLDDGEPYERTVYVETYGPTGWTDLGHYDGDEPPTGLPGMTPHALAGEFA